jgi:hypothetical protein
MKTGNWKMGRSGRRTLLSLSICLVPFAICHVTGCQSPPPSTQPSTVTERALRDPMGYKPAFDDHDISGGGITTFDKEAFKRDLDSALSP